MRPERVIKGLGEVALRVNDLDTMQQFYEDVVGLELMQRFPSSAFFKIADGYAGHTQILALFNRTSQHPDVPVSAEHSTIDHIAFAIAQSDFEAEKSRLESHGLEVRMADHAWVHWRSMYVQDPEDNTVELVCYDAAV
jgi:catechol 2,3-dioxygenase